MLLSLGMLLIVPYGYMVEACCDVLVPMSNFSAPQVIQSHFNEFKQQENTGILAFWQLILLKPSVLAHDLKLLAMFDTNYL